MNSKSPLFGKIVLAVDDEPDVLDSIADQLEMCLLQKTPDYDEAHQYLLSYTYDIVILDIMGVNGFDLLKTSVSRGFPTVMLTAHALSPESLRKSMKLGAVAFLPKEKLPELRSFLEEIVLGEGKPIWRKLLARLESLFDKRFGPGWKEKDEFFQEFEEGLRKDAESEPKP
jgi:CheY-like chemotaxis protein